MNPSPAPANSRAWLNLFRRFESLLAVVLLVEIVIFSITGTNFATAENFLQIISSEAEMGLLALAMTAVILTGGIDLSVGSLLALCAVLFGKLWRDGGLPLPVAALAALAIGLVGGALNAAFIARLKLPPLIVTLATFSLYRGIAEAITGGSENYTGFPAGFLDFLGAPLWRVVVLLLVALGIWLLIHRTTAGRTIRTLGFAPEGALYAGLPSRTRLQQVYLLAGLLSALAALLSVARVNQATADAGLGYEMFAITAVVLGGTSIFGGTGSVHGTLLGFLIVAVLRNGLLLSDLPSELAGILSGALLLAVLIAEAAAKKLSRHRPSGAKTTLNPLPLSE